MLKSILVAAALAFCTPAFAEGICGDAPSRAVVEAQLAADHIKVVTFEGERLKTFLAYAEAHGFPKAPDGIVVILTTEALAMPVQRFITFDAKGCVNHTATMALPLYVQTLKAVQDLGHTI